MANTGGVYPWSRTASSNATADATVNWAEGQAPSSVNDSARALMASVAKWRDDIAGAISTGGTATAYTVTSYQAFDTLADMNGQLIAFTPNATSTNAVAVDVTLNVDSLGAKPIRMQPNVTLPTGTLISGTSYIAVYNNSDGVFYLHNMTNPYSIPLGAGIDYWGSTTPSSTFAFPYGQAISRTTYATLFSLMGTTYGSGDGSTTFNLPDKRGRISISQDNMGGSAAGRVTTAGSSIDGTTLGATGGAQTYTLAQSDLPNVAPTFTGTQGTVTVSGIGIGNNVINPGTGATSVFLVQSTGSAGSASGNFTPQGTVSSINGNVTQTTTKNMPPGIVVPYILRVI